ncbi:hypothetical protein EVAR_12513_1 [Eumeta japonica]|uniref:Uncharacterized protein n=1 Tax=Eumeta variegata TaxID=151549 RepID=A0A4C1TPP8_EUMVA|nr:hypothetical protein EVAR_12513_1 [Eumeta japonica]
MANFSQEPKNRCNPTDPALSGLALNEEQSFLGGGRGADGLRPRKPEPLSYWPIALCVRAAHRAKETARAPYTPRERSTRRKRGTLIANICEHSRSLCRRGAAKGYLIACLVARRPRAPTGAPLSVTAGALSARRAARGRGFYVLFREPQSLFITNGSPLVSGTQSVMPILEDVYASIERSLS